MTPDQPPRLFKPELVLDEWDNATCGLSDVEILIKSAIEREDYMLEKLELALQNHNWWIIRALLLQMRKSR